MVKRMLITLNKKPSSSPPPPPPSPPRGRTSRGKVKLQLYQNTLSCHSSFKGATKQPVPAEKGAASNNSGHISINELGNDYHCSLQVKNQKSYKSFFFFFSYRRRTELEKLHIFILKQRWGRGEGAESPPKKGS